MLNSKYIHNKLNESKTIKIRLEFQDHKVLNKEILITEQSICNIKVKVYLFILKCF